MAVVVADEQLPVPAARAGEAAAWDTLFRRYQLPLYVYAFELLHDEQASLDVVQETFINAVRHIDGLREDARFGSWLFGIAHQKCLQRLHKRWREEPLVLDEFATEPADEPGPSEWLLRQETEERVMTLLNQLPPPQRAVLLLHFVEDFTLEQIAVITGAALGTVKSRLHYAKKALRKLIEDDEL
jgi:RNA polymerase sigma-70 factor (ECF subfamily)